MTELEQTPASSPPSSVPLTTVALRVQTFFTYFHGEMVCQALGFDTSNYSFVDVATWLGGGDIKATCERIQQSAATIPAGLRARI